MSTTIECGPEFYEKRRREWLSPKPNKPPAPTPPAAVLQNRQRLEEILNNPKRAHTEAAWREALKNVWSSFGSGRALSWPLPMTLVVRCSLIQALKTFFCDSILLDQTSPRSLGTR